ncbi:MAG: phosphonate metabolism transcriptional regulator PhnF, partial [Alphaproteobacteria bacterium]|nr:phosphonate metabolism transcriptional regulator PhnF [Alphaproteobacteria bacterium]
MTEGRSRTEPRDESGNADGLSQWRKVVLGLRTDITQGVLARGSRLPTEADLCQRFGVSRFTARRALSELEREGLIRLERNRGAYVGEDTFPYAVGTRTRYSENLLRVGVEPGRIILGSRIEVADVLTREELRLPSGAEVLIVEGLSKADGLPLTMQENRYPLPRFRGLDDAVRRDISFSKALARFGVADYKRLRTRIGARLPTEREARMLRLSSTRPVIATEVVDVDLDGRPICF